MTNASDYFRSIACPDSDYAFVVEDDGRVAYAYLLDEDEIVADVWLYNRAAAGAEADQSSQHGAAPLNHAAVVASERELSPPLAANEDCEVAWRLDEHGVLEAADLLIRGKLYARLAPGAKPGWCIAAAVDGPVARTLPER